MALLHEREPLCGGRFHVKQLLKAGQGIETFLGVDAERDRDVVIKATAVHSVGASALRRLEHEAQVLRDLRSPFLTPLIHLGHDARVIFLVMPFVDGMTLAKRISRGVLDARDTLTVALCVLRALQAAHDHGILHGDVKPANIIVDRGTPIETATLIDFGLARSARLEASIRDELAGTVRYISPEQAGLVDHPVDVRSDLYSLGMVMFEALAGAPPFDASSTGEILLQHFSTRPPDLRDLGASVPTALEAVIQRLVKKEPRERYQTTEALIADLTQISEALARGQAEPSIVVGERDTHGALNAPAFVARARELTALSALVEDARRGAGSLVFVEGRSGDGKTRLLDELGRRATKERVWVFRGQGVAYTAQRPFQLLGGLLAELLPALERDPTLASALRDRLGSHASAACAALPILAPVLGLDAQTTLGLEAHGEARTLTALATLIDALGTPTRPAVVMFDDCQWADDLTIKLLGQWRRGAGRQPRHVSMVAAFRSEEIPLEHALRRQSARAPIALEPLQQGDIERLVESMAGPTPDEVVDVVARLAEGSPFMAAAVVQGLFETHAIVPTQSGWRVDRTLLADVRSSRRAASVLTRRLELFDEKTIHLLAVGSLLGKQFEVDFACTVAGLDIDKALGGLREARRRHIVWLDGTETTCTFVHDKLRDALLEQTSQSRQRELHERAAERLEETHPDRVLELAYHFDAAGEHARALPYALEAGRAARAQHSLDVAETQYRIAERGAREADAKTRCDVAEALGDVLMLRGAYSEAADKFRFVAESSKDHLTRVRIEAKIGELEAKRANVLAACEALEHGLALLGRPAPKSTAGFVAATVGQIVVQVLHTYLPQAFLGKREMREPDRLATRLYSRLAYAYYFRSGLKTFWAHLRELNLAERFHPSRELGQAYSNHAAVFATLPMFERATRFGDRSLEIRRALGDAWGEGQSLNYISLVHHAASRYEACIRVAAEAKRVLERAGDRWEVHMTDYHTALCHMRLGRYSLAAEIAQKLYEQASEIHDLQAAGIALWIWAKSTNGAVPEALIVENLKSIGEDAQSRANLLHADGIRLFHADRLDESAGRFSQALEVIAKASLRNEYIAPISSWLATVRRVQLERCDGSNVELRDEALAEANRAAKAALKLARSFQNNLPHALREMGLVSELAGKRAAALRYLAESEAVARAHGAARERVDSALAQERLGPRTPSVEKRL